MTVLPKKLSCTFYLEGEDTRRWGPPFIEGKRGRESCYFLSVNRNKKSIGINFKHEKGRICNWIYNSNRPKIDSCHRYTIRVIISTLLAINLLRQLAIKSDVLVENFLPGKLSAYGLDYDSLKADAPHLIHCSITGNIHLFNTQCNSCLKIIYGHLLSLTFKNGYLNSWSRFWSGWTLQRQSWLWRHCCINWRINAHNRAWSNFLQY